VNLNKLIVRFSFGENLSCIDDLIFFFRRSIILIPGHILVDILILVCGCKSLSVSNATSMFQYLDHGKIVNQTYSTFQRFL
jgi:hypothetical protein